ncbi:MAG: hypothetical protein M1832_003521 [Thelocarpon impressellum]|nr:MAG: hypothetical protein M1832_003521 [Thelocarpon impressellum]
MAAVLTWWSRLVQSISSPCASTRPTSRDVESVLRQLEVLGVLADGVGINGGRKIYFKRATRSDPRLYAYTYLGITAGSEYGFTPSLFSLTELREERKRTPWERSGPPRR